MRIRDLEVIVETLGDSPSEDPAALVEHVRFALRRTICQQYRDEERRLHAVVLDAAADEEIQERLKATGDAPRSLQLRSH